MYAPLWCKSNFSFLEGASHPEELVEEAHRLGLRSIAITDRDGVYGMVRAHVKARELGVQLLCGAQVTVAAPGAALVPSPVDGPVRSACTTADHEADRVAPMSLARRGRTRRSGKRRPTADGPDRGRDPGQPRPAAAPPPGAPTPLVLLATDRAGLGEPHAPPHRRPPPLRQGRARSSSWREVCERAAG